MFNSFGHLYRVTTWGESHGLALGAVIDGCPPGIALAEADIQPWLDARRPGQSRFTTQRQEPGRRRDPLRHLRGPHHRRADLARDPQHRPALEGLRRHRPEIPAPATPTSPTTSSTVSATTAAAAAPARETAARVAVGVARAAPAALHPSVRPRRWSRLATCPSTAPPGTGTRFRETPSGPPTPRPPKAGPPTSTRCANPATRSARSSSSSPGRASRPRRPDLRQARQRPRDGADDDQRRQGRRDRRRLRRRRADWSDDEIFMGNDGPRFSSNHAGGILGGISTGQPVVARFAVKPTSSILTPRRTITVTGEETEINQGPPRPLRRHPRRPGRRGDARLRPPRPPAAAPRPGRRCRRPHRLTRAVEPPACPATEVPAIARRSRHWKRVIGYGKFSHRG